MISPTESQIALNFERAGDIETIKILKGLDLYSYFDLLSKTTKGGMYIGATIETILWLNALIHFLPRIIAYKIKKKRSQTIFDAKMHKSLVYKIENDIQLTKSEQKIYNRLVNKKSKKKETENENN